MKGRLGADTPEGPVLLLTTTGRKSGQPRTQPLLTMPDGDRFIVVASNGGRPEAPAWLYNVQADPAVQVQFKGETFPARARVIEGRERDDLWPRLKSFYAGWDHYRSLTDRTIYPVELIRT